MTSIVVKNPQPRFLLSEELHKLAKWLRFIGYDAKIIKAVSRNELVRLAIREKRVILTRQYELSNRKEHFKRLLVVSDYPTQQLQQVSEEFSLSQIALMSRCTVCNRKLSTVAKEHIMDRVPPYVLDKQTEYKICRKCGKIYWQGTHTASMQKTLTTLQIKA